MSGVDIHECTTANAACQDVARDLWSGLETDNRYHRLELLQIEIARETRPRDRHSRWPRLSCKATDGGSDKPLPVESYMLEELCGDVTEAS